MNRPDRAGRNGAAPDSVTVPLNYLVDTGVRPVTRITRTGDGASECSGEYAAYMVEIHDGRALTPAPTLERNGFALGRHDTAVADFYDVEEVFAVYYPEVERFVTAATGAKRVHVFDHNTRAEGEPRARHKKARGPVQLVHNDFSAESAPQRVRALLPAAEAEALLKRRLVVINVWRPIRGPLESSPLALCDAESIAPGDLVAADMVYGHRTGAEYRSTFNPAHRWYYFPRLERQEALLFTIYDSETDGRVRHSLHTAFDDPTNPPDAAPRESIEARVFAFF